MRSALVQLTAVAACSHALLAPQRSLRRTAGAKGASSLRRTSCRKAAPYYDELRALAGVAAAATPVNARSSLEYDAAFLQLVRRSDDAPLAPALRRSDRCGASRAWLQPAKARS